jgi:hypothetical protein
MLRATVSGSFHRHLHAISLAVQELSDLGIRVISPADPRIVETFGMLNFVASDEFRTIRLVQDRHLDSIRLSNFIWLVAPDGYVGQSASMEIGFAAAHGIPIFSADAIFDLTLREYVQRVDNIAICLHRVEADRPPCVEGLLINPHNNLELVRTSLDKIEAALRKAMRPHTYDMSADIYSDCKTATAALRLPTLRN